MHREPGSFRDPAGHVFRHDGRIYRSVSKTVAADFDFVRSSGLFQELIDKGQLLAERVVPAHSFSLPDTHCVLEHPVLPFVSYPYEWSFEGLKAAALLHLDVQIQALSRGVALSDASAYNVQFIGTRPVFIDHLSFRRYREGEFWLAQEQLCAQFLNPLLLQSHLGISFQSWYRGALEGIGTSEASRLLRLRHKLSWKILKYLVLPAVAQKAVASRYAARINSALLQRRFPRATFRSMLRELRCWIEGLTPAGLDSTLWLDYERSVQAADVGTKSAFLEQFVRATKPRAVWDIGCNTGRYSEVAPHAGADYVVGFDSDHGALALAFHRSRERELRFLPLFSDLANPAPNQGWAERERQSLTARGPADGVIALALIHHLVIGRNVPLGDFVPWLISLAEHGIVEFVPKADPQAQRLLALRKDMFSEYTESEFLTLLSRHARVIRQQRIPASGRTLIWFSRR